jgi:hypothetical protein
MAPPKKSLYSMILDKFTIQTQDSIAIAREKLTWQVEDKPSPFTINSTRVMLCGNVSDDGFRLCRLQGKGISITTVTGWFEALESGTLIHTSVELNLSIIIAYLCICLFWFRYDWHRITRDTDGGRMIYIVMITIVIVSSVFSIKDELRFYKIKLNQVFL